MIYQLYYNDKSKNNCFKFTNKIECENLTCEDIWELKTNPIFENKYIIQTFQEIQDLEMHGVISHAFSKKTRKSESNLLEILDNNTSEIITFNKANNPKQMMPNLERWHKGALQLFLDTLEECKLPYKEPKTVVYSNHFIARGDIYKDYIKSWLIPFCYVSLNKLDERYMKPAGYKKAIIEKGCDYTLHPFVIERLFSVYLANNNFKINEY